jgi:restriction endonuclease S subunit
MELLDTYIIGVQPKFSHEVFLNNTNISLPPLEVQTEIVKRLDALNEQIICLEKIESQSDENAKFVLDGYLSI